MKTWTKALALVGQIVGMMLGTSQPNYYGIYSIGDLAFLFGTGIPFALIGILVGLGIDNLAKPVEKEKVSDEKNTTKNYAVVKTAEIKNKNISITTEKINDSVEYAYSQVPIENKTNEKKIETAKLITTNIDEEKIWEIVADEFESDKRKKGLYAKLFAETGGDEVAIKAMYYKARVKELINENKNTAIKKEKKINYELASDEECLANGWYVKEEVKGFTCFLLLNGKAIIDLDKKQIIYRNLDAVKKEIAGYRVTGKFNMFGVVKEINKN